MIFFDMSVAKQAMATVTLALNGKNDAKKRRNNTFIHDKEMNGICSLICSRQPKKSQRDRRIELSHTE